MGLSSARSEPTYAHPAPRQVPREQPPPPGPAGPAHLSGRLGNGSYQATAKGAGAQPRSRDSSPTHSCPALGGQGTSDRRGDLGQVGRPALAWGRGPCYLGALPVTALRLALHPRGWLPQLPPVSAPPCSSLSASASSWFSFFFLCFSSSLPSSVSRPVSIAIWVSVPPTPPPLPPHLWGPLPHPRHTFQPPPPPGRPSPEPAASHAGCPGWSEWAQAGSEVSVQAGALEGIPQLLRNVGGAHPPSPIPSGGGGHGRLGGGGPDSWLRPRRARPTPSDTAPGPPGESAPPLPPHGAPSSSRQTGQPAFSPTPGEVHPQQLRARSPAILCLRLSTTPQPPGHMCTTPGNAHTHPGSASPTLALGPADLGQTGRLESARRSLPPPARSLTKVGGGPGVQRPGGKARGRCGSEVTPPRLHGDARRLEYAAGPGAPGWGDSEAAAPPRGLGERWRSRHSSDEVGPTR
ncbi:formin-like protein 5 [Suricata suricatta]|uniref:formin-like protein 5 n=1 Tax=Suricata suricatta TaxID=37032 RepID=UPI00115562EB|nr:formin-like protein 5 [Suricata suricatta]